MEQWKTVEQEILRVKYEKKMEEVFPIEHNKCNCIHALY